ncbi:MAG: hypothetical protein FWE84_00320 [Firmicutes bacterium]|nr:hypothetical protein [Bacillota bacterium]
MKLIDELEKSVTESIEMDKKSTFSGKLFGGIGLSSSILAFLLASSAGAGFWVSLDVGVKIWLWTHYPTLVFLFLGLFFSIKQRLRGRFMSANFSIVISIACVLIVIALIIVQIALLGKVYIYPFVTL